jgi:hypothetical protein
VSVIKQYIPYTSKPPVLAPKIDWKNPITKNLEYCWLLSKKGYLKDLVKGTSLSVSGTVEQSVYKERCLDIDKDTNGSLDATVDMTSYTAASMVVRFKYHSDENFGRILSLLYSGSDDFRIGVNNSSALQGAWDDGTTSIITGDTLSTNGFNNVVLTHDGTDSYLYHQGKQVGTVSESVDFAGSATSFQIGNNAADTNAGVEGDYSLVLIYSRALSLKEARDLHINPWIIFKGYYRNIPDAPSGVASSTATFNFGSIVATKKLKVYETHPADAGNGNAVNYDLTLDDVSQTTGTIDQTANGGAFNLIHTFTDLGAGTFKAEMDNATSGGNVIADAWKIDALPDDVKWGDYFDEEASQVAVSAHTPDYDGHSSSYLSSGATVESDDSGVKMTAQDDYVWKHVGVKDDVSVTLLFNPGSADNRLNVFLMGDDQVGSNGTPRNCYMMTFRTGVNIVQIARRADDITNVISNKQAFTIDNTQTYEITFKVDKGAENTLSVLIDNTLVVSCTDSSLRIGGYVGFAHATFTDNAARVKKMYAQSSDSVDSTAPSTPSGLSATAQSNSRIDLSCLTVSGALYQWYRDDVFIAETVFPEYSDTGLSASTLYTYKVKAVDSVYNASALSSGVNETTQSADSTPPTAPTNLTVVDNQLGPEDYIGTLSWTASTDADSGVESYNIYIDGILTTNIIGTSSLISVNSGRRIEVYVTALDYAGNESSASTTIGIWAGYPLIPTGGRGMSKMKGRRK